MQASTRAQVLRAVVESDEVGAIEYKRAFVAMHYYGYLRRTPEESGYQAWLKVITEDPNNIRIRPPRVRAFVAQPLCHSARPRNSEVRASLHPVYPWTSGQGFFPSP